MEGAAEHHSPVSAEPSGPSEINIATVFFVKGAMTAF